MRCSPAMPAPARRAPARAGREILIIVVVLLASRVEAGEFAAGAPGQRATHVRSSPSLKWMGWWDVDDPAEVSDHANLFKDCLPDNTTTCESARALGMHVL